MKDKATLSIGECYNMVTSGKKLLKEDNQGPNQYRAEIEKVYVTTDDKDHDLEIAGGVLTVSFRIEIAFEEWGIEGLRIPPESITIEPFTVKAMDEHFKETDALVFQDPVDASSFFLDLDTTSWQVYPKSVSLRVELRNGRYELNSSRSEISFS